MFSRQTVYYTGYLGGALWPLAVALYACFYMSVIDDNAGPAAVRDGIEPALLTLIFLLLTLAWERAMPYRRRWNRLGRREFQDWLHYFTAVLPAESLGRHLAYAVVPVILWQVLPDHGGVWPREWPVAVQVVLGILLFDLVYYWYHRLTHTKLWLWPLHHLHHTPRYLIVTRGFRHTFPEWGLDVLLHTSAFLLVGMPDRIALWVTAVTLPIGILSHANVRLPVPAIIPRIFNLPQTHRVHHDRSLHGGLSNYSGFFMIWDHVFGTFVDPGRYRPKRLGITGYRTPRSFWKQYWSFVYGVNRSS